MFQVWEESLLLDENGSWEKLEQELEQKLEQEWDEELPLFTYLDSQVIT